jgi:hypothetical protein
MVYHNGDTTEQEVSAHKGHKAPKIALTKGEETKGETTVEAPKSALPEGTLTKGYETKDEEP